MEAKCDGILVVVPSAIHLIMSLFIWFILGEDIKRAFFLHIYQVVTTEDIDPGNYTIEDVVLPMPGWGKT